MGNNRFLKSFSWAFSQNVSPDDIYSVLELYYDLTILFQRVSDGELTDKAMLAASTYTEQITALATLLGISVDDLVKVLTHQVGPIEFMRLDGSNICTFGFHLDRGISRRPEGSAEPIGDEYLFESPQSRTARDFTRANELSEIKNQGLPDWVRKGLNQIATDYNTNVVLTDRDGSTLFRDLFGGCFEVSFSLPMSDYNLGDLFTDVQNAFNE